MFSIFLPPIAILLLFLVSVYAVPLHSQRPPDRGLDLKAGNRYIDNVITSKQTAQSPGVSIIQGEQTIWDWQSNGGDERHLWVMPNGAVHAVYYGRTLTGLSRGSFYVFSSDNGQTFTGPVRVESMTADYPSMDVTTDGRAVIASHTGEDPRRIHINIDSSPGTGDFSQFDAPDTPVNCIWPHIAVVSDSNIVFWGSEGQYEWPDKLYENSWNTFNPVTVTFGFDKNQIVFPGVEGEIKGTIARSENGKVAILLFNYAYFDNYYGSWLPLRNDFGEGNIILRESHDGGYSFDDPITITNYTIDTTKTNHAFGHFISAHYKNEELHVAWLETSLQPELYWDFKDLKIMHWAQSVNNGVPTVVAPWDSLLFGKAQGAGGYQGEGFMPGWNHGPICSPSIGADENGTLTIVFTGFSGNADNADPVTGYAYGDIWAVSSADNGMTWSDPINLTNSPGMDDRYPYISTWNEADKINILYQSDTVAGSTFDNDENGARLGDKAIGNVDYFFLKTNHPPFTNVAKRHLIAPVHYILKQNYPNPFNPATTIEFFLPEQEFVTLKVINALGQLKEILVSKVLAEGSHRFIWHAGDHPSGLYFYRLTTPDDSQTRKMLLVR